MTLQELIELAILDAMALLDDEERERFEACFRAASPAVQAQVRREQTRLSHIESLLPDVDPPAGLRARVVQAVRDEMARSAADRTAGLIMPEIVPSRGVSPMWRATSLGLLAAMLVLTVTMFLFQSQHQRAVDQLRTDAMMGTLIDRFGPTFVRDVLFGQDTQRVLFVSNSPGFRGEAAIFVNPEWSRAKFFCNSLTTPDGRPFRLAIVDDDDNIVQVLETFTSNGGLMSRDIALEIKPNRSQGRTLAIIATEEGRSTYQILSRGKLQG